MVLCRMVFEFSSCMCSLFFFGLLVLVSRYMFLMMFLVVFFGIFGWVQFLFIRVMQQYLFIWFFIMCLVLCCRIIVILKLKVGLQLCMLGMLLVIRWLKLFLCCRFLLFSVVWLVVLFNRKSWVCMLVVCQVMLFMCWKLNIEQQMQNGSIGMLLIEQLVLVVIYELIVFGLLMFCCSI